MTQTKFTPAPWVQEGSTIDGDFSIYNKETFEEVLDIHTGSFKENNLSLILAAPELYNVLSELEESAHYWSDYDVPIGIVERIKQVLAKARGKIDD